MADTETRNAPSPDRLGRALAAFLRQELSTPAVTMRGFLDIIVEEANRLNNVVTRFLDYARAERPGREGADKVDLNAVVRKCEQHMASGNVTAARGDLDKARSLDPDHPAIAKMEQMIRGGGAPAAAAPAAGAKDAKAAAPAAAAKKK